jgi:hypothetical protein
MLLLLLLLLILLCFFNIAQSRTQTYKLQLLL